MKKELKFKIDDYVRVTNGPETGCCGQVFGIAPDGSFCVHFAGRIRYGRFDGSQLESVQEVPCPQVAVPNSGIPASAQAIPPRRFADGKKVQCVNDPEIYMVIGAMWKNNSAWFYRIADIHKIPCPPPMETMESNLLSMPDGCGQTNPVLTFEKLLDLTAIRAKLWAEVYAWRFEPEGGSPALALMGINCAPSSQENRADRAVAEFDKRFDPTAKREQPPVKTSGIKHPDDMP